MLISVFWGHIIRNVVFLEDFVDVLAKRSSLLVVPEAQKCRAYTVAHKSDTPHIFANIQLYLSMG